ncbi:hypothetical protein D3C86_312380 [compost metagenome]
MPIRRMALAGMVAAFGAGAWFLNAAGAVEQGSKALTEAATKTASAVKTETVKAVITQKGLSPAEQDALMGRFKAQYPRTAKTIDGWTPVTARKIEALNEAYQALSATERQAIAQNVSAWQQQVWKKYPSVRTAWNAGGVERERKVAENVLELAASDRAQLDTSVSGLWQRISTQNPQWAAKVDAIMSAE